MSRGFKVDFSGWDIKSARGKLLCWDEGFFDDSVWMNDQQLLGWFCEGHTPAGLRQLIHNNLKYWKCAKSKRHHRGWVLPLSADEFRGLAKRVPKPVHKANVGVVTELLGDIVNEAAKIGFRRVQVRKRIRKDEHGCYSEVFKALRANAVGVTRRAAEAMQHKISRLRGHLELISRLRAEHPGVVVYLPDDWETVTPQEDLERRLTPCSASTRRSDRRRFCRSWKRRWRTSSAMTGGQDHFGKFPIPYRGNPVSVSERSGGHCLQSRGSFNKVRPDLVEAPC